MEPFGAITPNAPWSDSKHFSLSSSHYRFKMKLLLLAGRIRAKLANAGMPIGSYDLQIAAIALANNLTLVTHNIREFERVEGLQIEDWEELT